MIETYKQRKIKQMTSEVSGIILILITLIIIVIRLVMGWYFYFVAAGKLREGKYMEVRSCNPSEGHTK